MATLTTSESRTGSLVAATALGGVLVWEMASVWLPSVIFIYGRAGSTPATELAAFALVPFIIALVLSPLVARMGRGALIAATAVVFAARLTLQASDGGDLQLWAATAGVLAGLLALIAQFASSGDRAATGLGLMLSLVGASALDAVLGGAELVWFDGLLPWLVLIAIIGGAIASDRAAQAGRQGKPVAAQQDRSAWRLLLLAPAMAIWAVVAGSVTSLGALTEASPIAAAAVIVLALLAGTAALLAVHASPSPLAAVVAAVLLALVAVLAPGGTVVAIVGGLAVGATIGVATARAPGDRGRATTPIRLGAAAAGGLFIWFVAAFLYYGSYDIALGADSGTLLASVLATGALASLLAARAWPLPGRGTTGAKGAGAVKPLSAAAAVLALVALAIGQVPYQQPDTVPYDGGSIRAAIYNIHMGFDTRGRYAMDDLAANLLAESPDIVVLNEIDRGWYLNGTHDTLRDLADRLDMPYVFVPAADAVWGNAIMSRFPLGEVEQSFLPLGGVPQRRSLFVAPLDLGDGGTLDIIGTHLHHRSDDDTVRAAQAAAVAERVAESLAAGHRVLVMGDLNAVPGSAALASLSAQLRDAVSGIAPALTFPSWEPEGQIDHVFTSPGLAPQDVVIFGQDEASDHLGIAVTITP